MKRYLSLVFSVLAVLGPLHAGEIRVSLLDDPAVLDDTVGLLRQNGSSQESVAAFRNAVHFHKTDLFDLSRFPAKKSGYYTFANVDELSRAIPDPFCHQHTTNDITHNSLVCLDLVVLLIKDAGAGAPQLQEDFAAKHFAKYENRGTRDKPDFVVNPETAYSFYQFGHTLMFPKNGYPWITGLERSTAEEDLGVSLKGERSLPGTFEDTDPAIRTLFATWNALRQKDGLTFPKKIKVVSLGYIPMKYKYWAIDHIAVCFTDGGKLIYLEKNGASGPFLRVDFNNEKELGTFAADKLLPYSRDPKEINYGAPVFVALNDRLIRIARP